MAVEDYPSLMVMHLDANFLKYRWNKRRLNERNGDPTSWGWVEEGMLVTAWQSASSAVEVRRLLLYMHRHVDCTFWTMQWPRAVRIRVIMYTHWQDIQTQREAAIVRTITEEATGPVRTLSDR